MQISTPVLKQSARERISSTRPGVFGTTVFYLIFTTIVSTLNLMLSGAAEVISRLNTQISLGTTVTLEQVISMYKQPTFFASLLMLALSIAIAVVDIGYTLYCLRVSRRVKSNYKDLFSGFEHFGRTIALIFLKGIIVLLLSMLFIIPGIIAVYRYSLAYYIMYDHPEYSAIDCLRESSRLMRGRKWELFMLQLSFIGWALLDNAIQLVSAELLGTALPIISIFLNPYIGITTALYYDALLVANGQVPPQPEQETQLPPQ